MARLYQYRCVDPSCTGYGTFEVLSSWDDHKPEQPCPQCSAMCKQRITAPQFNIDIVDRYDMTVAFGEDGKHIKNRQDLNSYMKANNLKHVTPEETAAWNAELAAETELKRELIAKGSSWQEYQEQKRAAYIAEQEARMKEAGVSLIEHDQISEEDFRNSVPIDGTPDKAVKYDDYGRSERIDLVKHNEALRKAVENEPMPAPPEGLLQ